ncbi:MULTISPECIES: acetyltransferase [unclassified Empedobacter]|uniref:acetyltransferase n=1 Tax=unclassified Empedobacter TaxID=2643773 RepID=UPI0025BA3606|nr:MULTISPECIES: acetyltransferase [unclassified Empedobacter]
MYLYGASGHGKVIAEIAEENNILIEAFIDSDQSKNKVLDYTVIHEIPTKQIDVVISIGQNATRKKIVSNHLQFNYLSLIHPKTTISKRAILGEGSVVMAGASVNSEVNIGKHCIINTNASIDHDCKIDDYVHISPNAALAGNVEVGEGTHIGIGASVIQGIKIGKWCTIGAGAVIIKDVPDGATVVGNPGKIIKIKDINE